MNDYVKQFVPSMKELNDERCDFLEDAFNFADHNVDQMNLQSEIEKLLVFAWIVERRNKTERFEIHPTGHSGKLGFLSSHVSSDCLDIYAVAPQFKINKFKADFVFWHACYYGSNETDESRVVVECDGHEFHERTKHQAASDKSREREIQTAGFPVLRFTGSEIWKNPRECVSQIDIFLGKQTHRISIARWKSASLPE